MQVLDSRFSTALVCSDALLVARAVCLRPRHRVVRGQLALEVPMILVGGWASQGRSFPSRGLGDL